MVMYISYWILYSFSKTVQFPYIHFSFIQGIIKELHNIHMKSWDREIQ